MCLLHAKRINCIVLEEVQQTKYPIQANVNNFFFGKKYIYMFIYKEGQMIIQK